MTQVNDKTDQQLNRALAELMGINIPKGTMGYLMFADSKVWYCTDPAASLEVQAKAIEVDAQKYVRALQDTKYAESAANLGLIRVSGLLTASPRERAEAAYITLQGAQNG
ncbi:hypothetical protein NST58_01630 [Paenibacillus sp. FSL R10-2796]|uniref:hypothetical protein n=1 Tax=Paenibacillus sp. FSL R10-2796 TaxID=2954663 RepID=UPI0030D9230B